MHETGNARELATDFFSVFYGVSIERLINDRRWLSESDSFDEKGLPYNCINFRRSSDRNYNYIES